MTATVAVDRLLVEAAALAAGGSADEALAGLLGAVGAVTGAAYAGVWVPTAGGPVEQVAWPAARGHRLATDTVLPLPGGTGEPRPLPGGDGSLPGPEGLGWLVLATGDGGPLTGAAREQAVRVARWIGLLAGTRELAAELERAAAAHRELAAAVAAAPERLRAARTAEQRRGVTEVLAVIAPPLTELRRGVADCAAALDSDPAAARTAGSRLGTALETLIDRFRVVVRGVHSTVLHEHGLVAALEEIAVDLPRPVRLVGGRPGPLRPEVASVLYPAAVAMLRVLAGAGSGPLELSLTTGELVTVRLAGAVPAPTRAVAALAAETGQLEAVGGRLTGAVDDAGRLRVEVSVPDGLRPRTWAPTGPDPEDLPARVRALGAAGGRAAALAARLAEPVRVAVTGPGAAGVAAVLAAQPGLVVTPDAADVVVTVLPPGADPRPPADPDGRYPLAVAAAPPGPGRLGVLTGVVAVELGADGTVGAGTAQLLALVDLHVRDRADALRCRTALRALGGVLGRSAAWEAVVAGAYELTELAVLAALRTGAAMLPAGIVAEAERLLGAAGPSAPARLGLAPGAGPAEIRVAATEQLARWGIRAEHRAGGRAGAEACRAAVLACERILAVTPG